MGFASIEKLRDRLRFFIPYDVGEDIRRQIREWSRANYKQKNTDTAFIEFMENNNVTFRTNHPQSENSPYYYTMFSVVSQHIQGDCVRECLDRAIALNTEVK